MFNPLKWAEGELSAIYTGSGLSAKFGAFASVLKSNVAYDMAQLGKDAATLTDELLEEIYTAVEDTVVAVIKNPAFVGDVMTGQISTAVGILVSEAAMKEIPALANASKASITTMATAAAATVKTGIVDTSQGILQSQIAAAAAATPPATAPAPMAKS